MEHLAELRSRVIRACMAVACGFACCLIVSKHLLGLVEAPVIRALPEGSTLVFTNLPDPFFMYIKVSFAAGVFVCVPYVLYQAWLFLRSFVRSQDRSLTAPLITFGTLLFYLGAVFCYFIVFPAAFAFFIGFQSAELEPMLAITEYVSLFLTLILAFGLAFETPLVIVLVGLAGVRNSSQIKKFRRYFIVLAFVIAALLTPTPDPLNQSLMALPMILLFEIGVRVLAHLEKTRRPPEEDEAVGRAA